MTREPIPSRRPASGAEPSVHGLPRLIENLAFFAILLMVSMRPLLSETYDSGLSGISQAVGDATSLTPATTVIFDLTIWLAALMATLAASLQRRPWRWTGIEVGWVLMAAAAAVSCWAASNKRLAINASCDWLTALVLAMTLANLLYERRRLILVLAVVVASGLASAAKCGTQKAWEFDDTWKTYQEQKQQFWAGQGIALSDPTVELFERRMLAREAAGFLPYSNAQAAGLALAGFAAVGVAMLAGARRDVRWAAAVLAGILFATIIFTGSRGALVATTLGLGVCLTLLRIERILRPERTWRGIWLVGWLTALAGTALVIGWGAARGLPGDSLRFRWEYWQVTSRIVADHPWTGVGALNFDRAYLMHKPVQYPEEIRDPHNFLMALLSQWGVVGAAGLIVALLGGSWVAIRGWGQNAASPPLAGRLVEPATGSLNGWIAALVVGFIALRLWMLRGWLLSGEAGVAAAFLDLGVYGIAWIIAFAGIALLLTSPTTARATGNAPLSPCEGGGNGHKLACLIGLAVFLLHNTIDFSLFVPGTLTTFAAVAAIAMARGEGRGTGGERWGARGGWAYRWAPGAVLLCGLFAVIWLVALPVTRCTSDLVQARHALATGSGDAGHFYEAAAKADPRDPTPLSEWASWVAHVGGIPGLDKALDSLHTAEDRDPLDRGIYRSQWRILQLRYDAGRGPWDLLQAVVAARRAVDLYPESPDGQVDLARLLVRVAAEAASDAAVKAAGRDWTAEAAMHYRKALDLDSSRPSYEIRRWPRDQRLRIEKELAQLKASAESRPAGGRIGPQTERLSVAVDAG